MPIYSHICSQCGPMDLERSMKDPTPTKCPVCKHQTLEQDYTTIQFVRPCDMFQENENKGMGKYYPSLGKKWLDPHTRTTPNPLAHDRSQNGAIEKAKRSGLDVSKA